MRESQTPEVTIVNFGPGAALDSRAVIELTLAHTSDLYPHAVGASEATGS